MTENSACPGRAIPAWKLWLYRIILLAVIFTPVILWPKVVGAAIVLLAVLLAVLWFGIKWKIKQFLRSIEEAGSGLGDLPETMPLVPVPDAKWRHAREVVRNREALAQLGFTPVGTFRSDDLDGMHVLGMIGPDKRSFGVVIDETHGSYVEFFSRAEDGDYIAHTNGAVRNMSYILDSRSLKQFTDLDASALFQRFAAYAPHRPRATLAPESFAVEYATLYLEKRDEYAMEREGEQEDQLREHRAAFAEQSGWSAAVWEERRARVFFVHDEMGPDEVAELYMEALELYEADYDEAVAQLETEVAGKSPRQAFHELAARSEAAGRIEFIMAVEGELPADAWMGPAPMSWDED